MASSGHHFALNGSIHSQSNQKIDPGREIGAVLGLEALLNIATAPHSYLLSLQIDPPLPTAVLSLEMGCYESTDRKPSQRIKYLVFYQEFGFCEGNLQQPGK